MNYLKKHVAMHEVNPIICYQLYTYSKKKKVFNFIRGARAKITYFL